MGEGYLDVHAVVEGAEIGGGGTSAAISGRGVT